MSSPLADLIQRGESGRTNYNAYNRGTYIGADGREHIRGSTGPVDFSSMTVGDVVDAQALPRGDQERLFAVGRYQVIPSTMNDAVNKLGLERSAAFTPDLQDQVFSDYLITHKKSAVRNYITDAPGSSLNGAQNALAQEWASIADPDTGKSYYDKPGGSNHASITSAETENALNAMRQSYRQAIESGVTPEQAWRQINSQAPQQLAQTQQHKRDAAQDGKLEQGERGEQVKQLQGQLAQLGAVGRDGKPLKPDGDFGGNTKYAVEQFQREHGLQIDGVAGQQTQAALSKALAQGTSKQPEHTAAPAAPTQAASSPLLSDPRHPDNAMYNGAVSKLEALGERGGFANRKELEQAAGQIVFESKVSGLQRIDHVVPNKSGDGFFAVQGEMTDPAMQRVFVDRNQAQNQPLENSSRQAAEESQRQATQVQTQETASRSMSM
ncbi:peptidoglycan-binding protein [Xanthomonas campestris pv. raphani]|nr:XVIPCD domain-containing protein [Xanthomonas campestris]MCC8686918.1 peptidoglycan-binding protein [Xanthomonas campestris]MCC8691561.1 peptidoglycan-binding protein [Xanthomonas campestris]MCW1998828.1 peptidoglycan hydrolase-like protein with peptidoglycan-binding domain [Xanthomonas campestris]MEA9680234.1 peptidoglycan-binding protein [Xanthomonas campestris pv. raphani]MEA9700000.1 peptidoglycan-binding protein [Xanthomonas campestris pv. raphani]